jgi:hypothetical protein
MVLAMIVFYIRLPQKKRKKKVGRTIIYQKRRNLSRERGMTEGQRERERERKGGREWAPQTAKGSIRHKTKSSEFRQ